MWGNPYTHLKGKTKAEFVVGSREESIAAYEQYLRKRLLSEPELIQELLKLEGQVLGCYCKPKSCHGDVIVQLLGEYLKQQ